ncbi:MULTISPECIES: DUF945 family protein [unclassified Gilliamella]|uniref:DUF945 family protein n=1 Tax=unclassified Gilliamella TaxID=2685620 RepID=UPI001325D58F|nr:MULTISPECIES: DUF945 family protein [unclassified Gilliamella]MWN31132.1 DUF945 family protein [Gilliamella sp. Pra-s60]MWP28303.1 DUF945 family protein [Gilliamella sp. Pra-s54]
MKKTTIAIGIVAVLGIAYVGTAWHTGNIIENNIDNQLAQITNKVNQIQNDFIFTVEKSNYDKGILSTKAHLKVTASQKDASEQINTPKTLFDDDITIHHGPFPVAALAKGTFAPQMAWLEYEMTEQTSPKLWKLAGNQPLITGHMGISYGQYITAKLANKAIEAVDKDINIGKGYFTVSSYIDSSDMVAKLQLDKLSLLSDDVNTTLSDLSLSLKPLNTLEEVNYELNIGNISTSKYSSTDFNIDNIKSTGHFNYKTQNGDLQGSIDKMTLGAPSPYSLDIKPLVFNNITMNQKNILNEATNIIDSLCFANIDSVIYGQQNLGNIAIDFNFQSLNKYWFSNTFDMKHTDLTDTNPKQNVKFSLNKLNWHTAAGDINIKLMLDLLDIDNLSLIQDNSEKINALKFKLEAPFDALAHISAQIENPYDNKVTQQQITKNNQSIQLAAAMLTSQMPFIVLSNGETNGFYSDISLTKDSDDVEVNGKTISKEEFFDNL